MSNVETLLRDASACIRTSELCDEKAVSSLMRADSLGSNEATYQLGKIYASRSGSTSNIDNAVRYFGKYLSRSSVKRETRGGTTYYEIIPIGVDARTISRLNRVINFMYNKVWEL
jgi:hypothetical protein